MFNIYLYIEFIIHNNTIFYIMIYMFLLLLLLLIWSVLSCILIIQSKRCAI